jgi:hypothetical protein
LAKLSDKGDPLLASLAVESNDANGTGVLNDFASCLLTVL